MALTKLTTDLIEGDLGGGTTWVSDPKTADFTAVAGEGYFVNTTSAAITVTLPSGPTAGDEVSIVDYAGTADTNNITITSSDNINGSSNDLKIDYERGGVSMVYVDATQGWIAYNAANETASALNTTPLTVDYLVVAGGGGGGYGRGGGGGAGGLRTSYGSTSGGGASAESFLTLLSATNYTVTVGPGGAQSSTSNGGNGYDSVFDNITSDGGGGGAFTVNGSIGGSGGGGTDTNSAGVGTLGQGFNGGAFYYNVGSGITVAGGGGGASQAGNTNNPGGYGGDGLSVSITGSSVPYAGGGGGGASQTVGYNAPGGAGGGGQGGSRNTDDDTPGSPNTGGGGGGGCSGSVGFNGSAGGSGVVILRYPSAYSISETTAGGNVLSFTTDDITVPGTKITTFTAGDGTIQFS